MPKKQILITHVYEVTFRLESETPLTESTIRAETSNYLSTKPNIRYEKITARELCHDEDENEICVATEGHRGRHESASGKRWGGDL